MAVKDKNTLSTALSFVRGAGDKKEAPESVIYGYVKLLLMDETALGNLFSSQEMKEIAEVRKSAEKSKLNLQLLKDYLQVLIPLIYPGDERPSAYRKFESFIEGVTEKTKSVEIFEQAIGLASIDIKRIFAEGKVADDVFEIKEKLKAHFDEVMSSKKETESKAEQKSESEPKPSHSEEAPKEEPEKPESKSEEQSGEEESSDEEDPADWFSLTEKYRSLTASLLDVIKGQDQAVLKFVRGLFQGEVFKNNEKKKGPRTYYFFFGPPGVGKTLLAETAAEEIGRPFRVFNMSEYAGHQSHEELIGTSKIYTNAKEGDLVKFVRENPECILVFDEIEKAHINVIRLFLQILSSGVLKNVYRDVDTSFKDTIIIFTSNLGKDLYEDRSVNLTTLPERVIVDAIQSEKDSSGDPKLPSEICSRIASGNTILFNHLSVRFLTELVNNSFRNVVDSMNDAYQCHITYAEQLPLLFIYNRGGEMDARIATHQSGNFLKNELYDLMRLLDRGKVESGLKSIHFDIDWSTLAPELKRLFVNQSKTEVLFFVGPELKEHLKIDESKYKIYWAEDIEQAKKYMDQDVTAVFIDPFYRALETDSQNILSISDFATEGVKFFHTVAETETGMPLYLIEYGNQIPDMDRKTFIQDGAADCIDVNERDADSFGRIFDSIMNELYMQKESCNFSQQGFVISYKTRQQIGENGRITVYFYDLKKRLAVDVESRDVLVSEAERPNVHFDDVIGATKAKEELAYFIDYLKNPKKFLVSGGKPPKGVLLYGPPGTGKTMLARAMAGESDVTFISTSASEFKNMWVGESEANIRRLFKRAKRYAPAIIFIDEIDAIGKQRNGSDPHSESMLNALLTELDGFGTDNRKPVFVLAATNYGVGSDYEGIANLDEALMRRFDNKIKVDLPDQADRERYISMMLAKRHFEVSEATIKNVAERTPGQSLAILQNIIALADRNASKEGHPVGDHDLLNALEEYQYGEKHESKPDYYKSVAIHETGHAVVSYLCGDCPSYITIESRGNFGGYMQHSNSEDVPNYSKEELLGKIRTSLAGRAAETVFFGTEKANNTGASSDLEHATHYAFSILCTYGMIDGHLMTLKQDEVLKSNIAGEYVERVNGILEEEMQYTLKLIEEHKDIITKVSEALLAANHLTGEEFKQLMESEKEE